MEAELPVRIRQAGLISSLPLALRQVGTRQVWVSQRHREGVPPQDFLSCRHWGTWSCRGAWHGGWLALCHPLLQAGTGGNRRSVSQCPCWRQRICVAQGSQTSAPLPRVLCRAPVQQCSCPLATFNCPQASNSHPPELNSPSPSPALHPVSSTRVAPLLPRVQATHQGHLELSLPLISSRPPMEFCEFWNSRVSSANSTSFMSHFCPLLSIPIANNPIQALELLTYCLLIGPLPRVCLITYHRMNSRGIFLK